MRSIEQAFDQAVPAKPLEATMTPALTTVPATPARDDTPRGRVAPCRAARPQRSGTRVPRPAATGSGRTRRRGLRLTRRGRLLLVLVVSSLLLAAFSLGRVSSTAATDPAERAQLPRVVVHSGDTLWSIARAAQPQADPRVTVQRITDLNGLSGVGLVPGQELVLPGGSVSPTE